MIIIIFDGMKIKKERLYYYYYIHAMMMRCWKWIRRWDEEEDGPKKNGEKPWANSTTNYEEKYEKNMISQQKRIERRKKVCKLVKFSCFLSLPTEKLNFSKNNQFLPKKIFLGENNLSEHNYRVFPQNRGKSWESRPGSSSHWKKDRSTEGFFFWQRGLKRYTLGS